MEKLRPRDVKAQLGLKSKQFSSASSAQNVGQGRAGALEKGQLSTLTTGAKCVWGGDDTGVLETMQQMSQCRTSVWTQFSPLILLSLFIPGEAEWLDLCVLILLWEVGPDLRPSASWSNAPSTTLTCLYPRLSISLPDFPSLLLHPLWGGQVKTFQSIFQWPDGVVYLQTLWSIFQGLRRVLEVCMGPRASWSHLLIAYIPQVCYQVTGLAGFLITLCET